MYKDEKYQLTEAINLLGRGDFSGSVGNLGLASNFSQVSDHFQFKEMVALLISPSSKDMFQTIIIKIDALVS
jgi:hypothetical protein